jgi:hypothetical protein
MERFGIEEKVGAFVFVAFLGLAGFVLALSDRADHASFARIGACDRDRDRHPWKLMWRD